MKAAIHLSVLLIATALNLDAQNLLVNGSFEQQLLIGPGAVTRTPGATNLLGWSIGGAGSLYQVFPDANSLSPIAGSQYVDFNGKNVSLSQSFPTMVGETYEVRFAIGRFQSFTSLQIDAVLCNGESGEIITSITASATTNTGWNMKMFRFIAMTSTSSLQFTNATANVNVDLELDDVTVEHVPQLGIARSDSGVELSWESQSNQTYQLQYLSDAATNSWMDLGSPKVGTGTRDSMMIPATGLKTFYRISKPL